MEVCDLDGGHFRSYIGKFRKVITADEFERFAQLTHDRQRFTFVDELKWKVASDLGIERSPDDGKTLAQAMEQKVEGNNRFQYKDWSGAIQCYNQSYLLMPEDHAQEKALVLANRAAALLHQNNYDQAIDDIERAMSYGYPKELLYKLWERKGRCYESKKDYQRTWECFEKSLDCLQHAGLSPELLDTKCNEMKKKAEYAYYQHQTVKRYLEPPKEPRTFQPQFHEAIRIDCTEREGRFARASADLRPNQTILKERPHVAALARQYSLSHCSQCFLRIFVLFCCPKCSDVVFCSGQCERAAQSSYHKYECGFLKSLWSSGATIVSHLALRIVAQRPYAYFNAIREELEHLTHDNTEKLPDDDYRKLWNLVTHSEKRSTEDYLIWTLMASMLNTILTLGGYMEANNDDGFLGYLLLHNLQIVNYNAHSVSEVQRKRAGEAAESVTIGAAMYPMLALFNHSCDPSIVRYFTGTTVIVRTIKNIASGSMIAENYGPLYTKSPRDERRTSLQSNYKFECNCQPCTETWPTFTEMDQTVIRFKCTGATCPNAILFDVSSTDFTVSCDGCGATVDITERIKLLQDANMLQRFNDAKQCYQMGLFEKSLSKYTAILVILDDILVPPYRDYHLCQQGIRRCCLDLGSCYVEYP